MVVHRAVSMASLASQLQATPLALVAAAGGPPVLQVLAESTEELAAAYGPSASPVTLLVGPEGDFTGMLAPILPVHLMPVLHGRRALLCMGSCAVDVAHFSQLPKRIAGQCWQHW